MLFFALLLQALPDRDPTQETAFPRILDVAAHDCANDGCAPGRRYRLEMDAAPAPDHERTAMRGVWQRCGTTGAPMCPSEPRTILRTALD